MSRIPQPAPYAPVAWRPEPKPADYSDEISEKNFAALRKISDEEAKDEEFDIVDGPAW